jgi:hypothetical protein
MQYITIKDHIITGHFCGSFPDTKEVPIGEEYLEVNDFGGLVGDDIRIYEDTENWQIRHLADLVAESLVTIPEKKKLSDNGSSFVDMTTPELIEAGYLTLKDTEKVVNGEIAQKTKRELYDEGIITSAEYNEYIDSLRKAVYSSESDPIGMEVLRGETDKSVWLAKIAEIKQRFPKV